MLHAIWTTDTRKAHCPIRIMYARDGIEAAQQPLHASGLTDGPGTLWSPRECHDCPLAIIKGTEFSDYSGSAVERSNYRVILGDCREGQHRPGIIEIIGSHGYQALAYDATLGPVPGDEELCDMLATLEQYTVLDDDDHTDLENELESEAWDDHGRTDFRNAMIDLFDDIDPDHEHELPDDDERHTLMGLDAIDSVAATWGELWWDIWRWGCDEFSVNGGSGFTVETGGVVHFYLAEWVRACNDMERTNPSEARLRFQRALQEIAEACRVGGDR